jgi:hypothetical protein
LLLEARGEFDEALEEFRRGAADGDDLARKGHTTDCDPRATPLSQSSGLGISPQDGMVVTDKSPTQRPPADRRSGTREFTTGRTTSDHTTPPRCRLHRHGVSSCRRGTSLNAT